MAWLMYLVALILWNAFSLHGWAMFVFAIGMVIHWKYWAAGLAALFVGFNWKKIFE